MGPATTPRLVQRACSATATSTVRPHRTSRDVRMLPCSSVRRRPSSRHAQRATTSRDSARRYPLATIVTACTWMRLMQRRVQSRYFLDGNGPESRTTSSARYLPTTRSIPCALSRFSTRRLIGCTFEAGEVPVPGTGTGSEETSACQVISNSPGDALRPGTGDGCANGMCSESPYHRGKICP
jgi:hypothetical protein